jgi:hypothetical protein
MEQFCSGTTEDYFVHKYEEKLQRDISTLQAEADILGPQGRNQSVKTGITSRMKSHYSNDWQR